MKLMKLQNNVQFFCKLDFKISGIIYDLHVCYILYIFSFRQMKSNIYDLTQFGCMMQTAMTIEKSLKNILEKLIDKENENDELNQKIKNLKKEIQRKNGKIALLEQECGVLNEKNKRSK